MLKKWLLQFAFFLHGSARYKSIKQLATNLLNNADYEYKRYFDTFMISLIVLSIAILVYEVKNPIPSWIDLFDIYLVTTIFLLEYIARVWVHNDWHKRVIKEFGEAQFLGRRFSLWKPTKEILRGKLRYLLTPTAIIDLLAILPAYRPLRVLRIFVLFRVFKLLRYTKSINQFLGVLGSKKFELYTLLFLLIFITVTAGIAIYVFEQNHNNSIETIFDALYWALITISTVGYGDISPVTPEGRVVSMLIIVSGIAMISFVTSVIVSSFSEKLDELKENRIIEEVNKKEEFMIICGYGQMTRMFLKYYAKEYDKRYIVIEKDKDRVEEALKEGYRAIHEDASRHDVIKRFNLQYSNITLLALTGDDIANIYITLNAKSLSHKIRVIARARTEKIIKKYQLAGADSIVRPSTIADRMLFTAITQPVMYKAIYAILTGKNMALLDEVSVDNSPLLIGKRIEELNFMGNKLLCIGLQEGGEDGEFIFNPTSEIILKEGDILLVMGRKVSIDYFREIYQKEPYV
jgi:voltage-gated potassium channel